MEHQHRLDLMTPLTQHSRSNQTVAAVVSLSADDEDLLVQTGETRRLLGQCHTCGLHQVERGDTPVLDRPAVVLAHLRGIEAGIEPFSGHLRPA